MPISQSKLNIKGVLQLSWVKDGVWTPFLEQSNLCTYDGTSLLTAALTGKRVLNAMYLCYENSNVQKYTADASNDAAYYANEITGRGLVRVTTLSEPVIESEGANYHDNKITVRGVTDGSAFFPGTPVTDGVSSFYHTALASLDPEASQSSDIILSCSDIATPVTKVAGAHLGIKWSVIFKI